MGFQTGLSGLNAASKNLDVIGNNVANSGTVGFKAGQAQFADVYAASLTGGGASQVGIGTRLATVAQQFTQGNVTATGNSLDVAINGKGFFVLSNNGAPTYSRNGQFQLDKTGNIVTSGGLSVQGFQVDTNGTVTGAQGNLKVSTASQPPQITGGVQQTFAGGTGVKVMMNLDSRATPPITPTFTPTDATSYTQSTSLQIYDSLGNAHTQSLFFGATTVPGTWDVHATIDGVDPFKASDLAGVLPVNVPAARAATMPLATATATAATLVDTNGVLTAQIAAVTSAVAAANALPALTAASTQVEINAMATAVQKMATLSRSLADATKINYPADATVAPAATLVQTAANAAFTVKPALSTQLVFDTAGKLTTIMPFNMTIDLNAAASILGKVNGASQYIKTNMDFSGSTQFGSKFGVNSIVQDGYAAGELAGFNIGTDGILQGRYTNGQTRTLGQVALANFANPQGLQSLGNNQWSESPSSGAALVGQPGSSGLGILQSSATEDSNVDLTQELVNMIVAQRAYQANAQTIKTQDAIQQTLMNLR